MQIFVFSFHKVQPEFFPLKYLANGEHLLMARQQCPLQRCSREHDEASILQRWDLHHRAEVPQDTGGVSGLHQDDNQMLKGNLTS